MGISTWITIGIVAVAIILLVGLVTFLFLAGNEEKKQKRVHMKSKKIRDRVQQQVEQVRLNLKEKNISLQDTPEGKKLDKALRECDYLVRDGYRSTEKIERISSELPHLEKECIAAAQQTVLDNSFSSMIKYKNVNVISST